MTAPERRRPLPALAFIGALCLLTAIVWFRVIHRSAGSPTPAPSSCTSASATHVAAPNVVPHPNKVSVLVLNSTNRSGIATATKKQLQKRGFRVTDAKNDSATYGGHGLVNGVAEIRFGPAAAASATLLRFYFPHAQLKQTDASSDVVAVSLGRKFHAVASQQAARKAMRAAHVRMGTVRARPTPSASC